MLCALTSGLVAQKVVRKRRVEESTEQVREVTSSRLINSDEGLAIIGAALEVRYSRHGSCCRKNALMFVPSSPQLHARITLAVAHLCPPTESHSGSAGSRRRRWRGSAFCSAEHTFWQEACGNWFRIIPIGGGFDCACRRSEYVVPSAFLPPGAGYPQRFSAQLLPPHNPHRWSNCIHVQQAISLSS
jgi:hypothetical protein